MTSLNAPCASASSSQLHGTPGVEPTCRTGRLRMELQQPALPSLVTTTHQSTFGHASDHPGSAYLRLVAGATVSDGRWRAGPEFRIWVNYPGRRRSQAMDGLRPRLIHCGTKSTSATASWCTWLRVRAARMPLQFWAPVERERNVSPPLPHPSEPCSAPGYRAPLGNCFVLPAVVDFGVTPLHHRCGGALTRRSGGRVLA